MSTAIGAETRAHEVRLVSQLGMEMEEVRAWLQPHFYSIQEVRGLCFPSSGGPWRNSPTSWTGAAGDAITKP